MACAIYKAGNDKNAVPCCALREAVHFLILEGCSKCVMVRMTHVEIKSIDISCRNEDFLPLVGKTETSYSRRWTRSCLNSKRKLAFLSAICLSNISLLEEFKPSVNRNGFATGMKRFNPHEQHLK